MPDIKLGSLFDGIGVFPLAASRCGIRPVWASEIEKAPISITKRHFPDMAHLGDITKVDGGKIPPVHVITFGSPCQNLSLIGCGSVVDEDVKNDIAVAGRRGIAATTLEGVLAVKGHGTPGHAGH